MLKFLFSVFFGWRHDDVKLSSSLTHEEALSKTYNQKSIEWSLAHWGRAKVNAKKKHRKRMLTLSISWWLYERFRLIYFWKATEMMVRKLFLCFIYIIYLLAMSQTWKIFMANKGGRCCLNRHIRKEFISFFLMLIWWDDNFSSSSFAPRGCWMILFLFECRWTLIGTIFIILNHLGNMQRLFSG